MRESATFKSLPASSDIADQVQPRKPREYRELSLLTDLRVCIRARTGWAGVTSAPCGVAVEHQPEGEPSLCHHQKSPHQKRDLLLSGIVVSAGM
jgi:hypothetical protein